jgi:hypothetical protein
MALEIIIVEETIFGQVGNIFESRLLDICPGL